jgi:hypothetical protein
VCLPSISKRLRPFEFKITHRSISNGVIKLL